MKLSVVRTVRKEDLGKDVPQWATHLVTIMNEFIEDITDALRNRLTFADNLDCKVVTLKFTSGTEQLISLSNNRRAVGIIPVEVLNSTITGFGFTRKTNGQIGITLTWTGGGSQTATVLVLLG